MTDLGRRALMAGAAGLGLALTIDACTGHDDGDRGQASAYSGQYRLIALSAALENQAVSFYRALLTAQRGGKLGPPVPALASLAQACAAQHAAHAQAWNAILHAAGRPVITGVPLTSQAKVMRDLKAATGGSAACAIAVQLEDQAAQTFAAAAAEVSSTRAVTVAASIAPVEAMHAAVLRLILGEIPVPASFPGQPPASPHDLTA